MKTMIYKINWLLVIFITTNCNMNAQCSEAENATMKKYAELTRTGDTQACSHCAWLANLFCIAENGLYKNDKFEVQNAIDATKQNIKLMGDPICCLELLTKTPKFGQQKNGSENKTIAENSAAQQSQTMIDIQDFANEVNSAISTMENLNAINKTGEQLQKDLDKVEKLMQENATMSDREYQSEEDINNEYNIKLANLKKLAATHLELKTQMPNLGYSAAGELLNNPNSTGLGAFAAGVQ
ncbi:hypothetical protein [Soonwooa sp.]|uniref:hypothetical protein n=3 Tax=Soonwooa sp. TaxID=1938592 RepID=UPI0028B0E5FE|nr:hypothetical protein [Soonwooa sp.]